MYKRDDKGFTFTFVDSDGAAVDLTGDTIFFTVKENETDVDADALIRKDITPSDPTGGIATMTITHTESDVDVGDHYFDVQRVTSGGTVTTITKGTFKILQDITIRTS